MGRPRAFWYIAAFVALAVICGAPFLFGRDHPDARSDSAAAGAAAGPGLAEDRPEPAIAAPFPPAQPTQTAEGAKPRAEPPFPSGPTKDAGPPEPSLTAGERALVESHASAENAPVSVPSVIRAGLAAILPVGSVLLDVDCGVKVCRIESRHRDMEAYNYYAQRVHPHPSKGGGAAHSMEVPEVGVAPSVEVRGDYVLAVDYLAVPKLR